MALVLLLMLQGRTSGGHGLLEAVPRIYQVTPDIPDRRRATQQKEVRPTGRQPQRESARRPVGTFSSASDVTETPDHNSKLLLEAAARLDLVWPPPRCPDRASRQWPGVDRADVESCFRREQY